MRSDRAGYRASPLLFPLPQPGSTVRSCGGGMCPHSSLCTWTSWLFSQLDCRSPCVPSARHGAYMGQGATGLGGVCAVPTPWPPILSCTLLCKHLAEGGAPWSLGKAEGRGGPRAPGRAAASGASPPLVPSRPRHCNPARPPLDGGLSPPSAEQRTCLSPQRILTGW